MADLEYHQAQEVPPPESSTISTTGRRTLLATPSREEIAASGGLMEVGLERFQADQGQPSRRWEDLWWCHSIDCGKSNFAPRTTCGLCGAGRYHPLHHVVRGLKRKLEDAEQFIAELLSKQRNRGKPT